jgi:hypothetical protein
MQNMKKVYFLFIVLFFVLTGCETETIKVDELNKGYEYYPLNLGNSWVYEYDSIIYDPSLGIIDTASGYIKEEITEKLEDDRFIIQRSWKAFLSDPWLNTDRWTIYRDQNRLVKTEENLSFIKLVFPVSVGRSWDGNALFEESIDIYVAGESIRPYFNWNYEITSDNETYSYQNIDSDNVILINQVKDTSIVDLRFSEEKYAPNIGLVEKFTQILDCSCFNIDTAIPWEEKAEKGFILKQKLIKYN